MGRKRAVICPWIDSNCNEMQSGDNLRTVQVPDVVAGDLLQVSCEQGSPAQAPVANCEAKANAGRGEPKGARLQIRRQCTWRHDPSVLDDRRRVPAGVQGKQLSALGLRKALLLAREGPAAQGDSFIIGSRR
eukprot:scaffold8174_cov286-Pinguiococcus_pyrenoidosus.AAC.1